MTKRKIYFVQPNSMIGNSVYLPYAAGVLLAYAMKSEKVSSFFEIGGIIFKEDTEPDVMKHIDNPAVVAFSNYSWNYTYNLKIAAAIKEKFPGCFIFFGGHQVSKESNYLGEYKFIDALLFGEGEVTLRALLEAIADNADSPDFSSVFNIAYRRGTEAVFTPEKAVCPEDYPSPYGEDIFDYLLNYEEGIELNAQLETNRGCPYHCSYCDWCDYGLPFRKFPMERVKKDLEWISEHKISYCMCIDSNFGIFDRDEEIAEYAVELKKKTGFPAKLGACFAKNKTERIFRMNKILNDAGMCKGASLAFQSMSEEVLRNVSRDNMNKDSLAEQLKLYHKAGIPTYSELILGLPGETLESFKKGMCELIELGQHEAINVFRCEVHPNALMSREDYIEKFSIKTCRAYLNVNHCKSENAGFSGGLELIYSTSTMSHDEFVEAFLYSAYIQAIHCHGLMKFPAVYARNMCGVSYYDFYEALSGYIEKNTELISAEVSAVRKTIAANDRGEIDLGYIPGEFSEITWPYDEAMFLAFVTDIDKFYEEIRPFMYEFTDDEELIDDLFAFQKASINVPGRKEEIRSFGYNWAEYFTHAICLEKAELKKMKQNVLFTPAMTVVNSGDYAREIVWYGRRNNRCMCTWRVAE